MKKLSDYGTELAGSGSSMFPNISKRWALKRYLRLTEKEINENKKTKHRPKPLKPRIRKHNQLQKLSKRKRREWFKMYDGKSPTRVK